MTAEQLHNALTNLPEDLLIPLESIRKKRPFPWKALGVAAAACLVLCIGLLFPIQEKSGTSAPESAYNGFSQADPQEQPDMDKEFSDSTNNTESDETTEE